MKTETTSIDAIASEVLQSGMQGLGRRQLSKVLGISERQVRKVLEVINSAPPETDPVEEPRQLEVEAAPPTVSFTKRPDATELTNWREWVRESQPPQRFAETDRKGNPKTLKVVHDPGIAWPPTWDGPKSYDQLLISNEAPKARPMKWGFLVTAQQSHTPIHGPALMAFAAYCGWGKHNLVMLGVETKPPSGGSKVDQVATWSAATERYVTTERHDFGGVVLDGAFPMKPTLEDPLDGLGAYCNLRNHIFGSMRQDSLTLGRIEGDQAMAWCSGAVTVPNYAHSKAGMIAIDNHTIGAVLVECDFEDRIFIRNLELDPSNGELWHVDIVVENGVVRSRKVVQEERDGKRPIVNSGCVHARWADEGCLSAIYGIGGRPIRDIPMIQAIDPSDQVLHDAFDAYSVSPHNRKNPAHKIIKRVNSDDNVADELKLTADLIHAMGGPRRTTWLVDSNHDRHFERFLLETDWKPDIMNAETLLSTNLAMVRALKAGDQSFSPLAYALRQANPKVNFNLSRFDEPLKFHRYYYHMHGDKGTNGSSGSDANLASLGIYLTMAHSHSARRRRRIVRTGCIITAPPHAKGAHNRAHAVGIEYPNGSYQLIPIVGGKWRP